MGWPHYPYVEGVYDKLNLLWKIGTGTSTIDLAYPDRSNYQKVSLFSNAQGSVERHVGRAGGSHPPWKVYRNYDGDLDFDALTWAYIVAHAPLTQGDWTRKYFREVVDNTSATEFYGGQPVANGQRAYRRSDRQIVDRVAGAWVPNLTATAPDVITTGGGFQAGDIIGDWLFNEIEAAIALLGTLGFTSNWGGGSGANEQVGDGIDPDWPTAQTGAEGAFATNTPSTSANLPAAWNTGNGGPPSDYLAELFVHQDKAIQTLLSTLAPATADFYQAATPKGTFSSQGYAVLNGVLKKWSSVAVVAGTATSAYLGDITTAPNSPWVATPNPADPPIYTGWVAADFPKVLVKFTI